MKQHRFPRLCSLLTALCLLVTCLPARAEGPLYEETFSFSYMYPIHPVYTQDNLFDQYLDEYLNMKVEWIQVAGADFDQKLSVLLSSGDLPDVIRVTGSQVPTLLDQGAIIALDDLMAEYGADIAAEYEKWNGARNAINPSDGHIYGVYSIEGIESANCIAVRQDWLDQLGLPMPETLDEWLDTWYAFKENNLGGEQTYPIGNVINPIFDAFGVQYTRDLRYVVLEDGSLVNRYEHEHYLEALTLLAQLYADGIINPYVFTQSTADFDTMVYSGCIGTVDHSGSKIGQEYNVEMEKSVENAWFTPTSPILGPYGDQTVRGRAGVGDTCAVITVQADAPDQIMKYLNWCYSEEGITLTNFGIEGETYDLVDGRPVLRSEWCNYTEKLWNNGIGCTYKGAFDWSNDQFVQVMFGGKSRDQLNRYDASAYAAYMEVNSGYTHGTYLQFTTPTEIELGADLWSQLSNAEQQAIAGEITLEEFQNVLARVKAAGMDQIMAEAQDIWMSLGE